MQNFAATINEKYLSTFEPLILLIWFYDISTIFGYLMSNPVFTYIKDIIYKHIL